LNVSIAYSPEQLQDRAISRRFDVELAYWDIRLDRAITALDAQVVLDGCVLGGDDRLCSGISRTNQGSINGFRNTLLNTGGIETRGLDFNLSFDTKAFSFGRFSARWLSSYLLDYWEKFPTSKGAQTVKLEGKVKGIPERVFPKLKSNLVLAWYFDQVGVIFTTRYISGVTEECRGLADLPDTCSDPNTRDELATNWLAPKVYNDLRIVWTPKFEQRLNIAAGANNIFNVDPPACYSCSLNNFNPGTYDIPGVFGYLSAGYVTD
jgi:iron complex outermembrane receptor protein